jgi:hypothetical protein
MSFAIAKIGKLLIASLLQTSPSGDVCGTRKTTKCIKRLIEQAGWTEEVGKMRKVRGISRQIKREGGKVFRFCDLATSHLMRRTAITTMLMNGVPESVIKQLKVGVRIKEIIDDKDCKGFSYETLQGHVEKGISTFIVEQKWLTLHIV